MNTTATKKTAPRRVTIAGRAAIYTRVSTGKQAGNGASLEVQREACRRYCEDHGYDVVAEYQDVESGLHNGRHQYQQALELARTKGMDKLIVWRLDRLGRDNAEYAYQLKALKKNGVDVVSVTQPSESALMQSLLGVLAEEESRQISIRTLATKQRRTQAGLWQSPPPLGYETAPHPEGGRYLVPHPTQGPIVSELFSRYASGSFTLGRLQKWLAERGIRRSYAAIGYILKNPLYLGRVRHGHFARSPFNTRPGVTEYQGKHEALVDEATFQRVQERLSNNFRRQRGGPAPKYLFSGLIFCGACSRRYVGKKRVGKSGKLDPFYRCGRKQDFGDCRGHSVQEGRVRTAVVPALEAVLEALGEARIREAVCAELKRQQEEDRRRADGEHGALVAAIEKLEGRLSRLEDAYLDGDIPKARYMNKRDELQGQISELRHKLSSMPPPTAVDTTGILALAEGITVESLDEEGWREVVETVVDKILVKNEGKKRKATVEVHWKAGFDVVAKLAEVMRDA